MEFNILNNLDEECKRFSLLFRDDLNKQVISEDKIQEYLCAEKWIYPLGGSEEIVNEFKINRNTLVSEDLFKRYCYTAKESATLIKGTIDEYDNLIFQLIKESNKESYWKLKEVTTGYSVTLSHLIEAIDFYIIDNTKKEDEIIKNPTKFEYFLTDEGKKDLSIIIQNYKNAKGKSLACLLYALHDLKYLDGHPCQLNQTKLFESLKNILGEIGTRQALNKQITAINEANDLFYKSDIDKAKALFAFN